MSTYSPDLRIELITTGDQAGTWGATTNTNLSYVIEQAVAGYISVSVISANQALTYINGGSATAALNQSVHAAIALTTTTGANFAVYAPPASKQYTIYNASSYTATIYNSSVIGNTTAAGTGVAIPAGKTVTVWSDGTNFALQNTHFVGDLVGNATTATTATNVSGVVAVANGGTNATTASAARTNLGLAIGTDVPSPTGTGASGSWNINAATVTNGVYTTGDQTIGGTKTFTNGITFNDATVQTTAAVTVAGSGGNLQVFTSGTTTWTAPAGVTKVRVTVVGGGGGGGSATTNGRSGGGGGGAGCGIGSFTVVPGTGYSVVVGSGGAATASGGSSSFGGVITATGGGAGGSNLLSGGGGAAGSCSGGSINFSGVAGGEAFSTPCMGVAGGAGGAFAQGNGVFGNAVGNAGRGGLLGTTTSPSAEGQPGTGFGCGGGGACKNATTNFTGGAGASGIVYIEW